LILHEEPHEGRHFPSGGTCSKFRIPGSELNGGYFPFSALHPFRSVLPSLSTSNSVLQVERGHPSWQNPHGTKSHDPQPLDTLGASLGSVDGAMVVGMLLGDEEGANDACPVGSLLVPGSLLQQG